MIKLIFVDIDNTLLDFDAYVRNTLKIGLKKFGLRPYEPWMYDVFTRVNQKLWWRIEEGTLTFEHLHDIRFNMVFEEIGIDFDGITFENYFRYELNNSAIPVEGAYEMLEELSRDYILCTASNGPYNQQVHRMEISHMDKYFDYQFVSEKNGASKPAKEFFDYAFNEINSDRNDRIKPQECLIIGDSETSDMAGGINYGMKTAYYMRKPQSEFKAEYDVKTDNLRNMAMLIKELN